MTTKRDAKTSKKAKTSESYNQLVNDIARLLLEARRFAEEHGLFPNHRELLECRHCGLMEDVTIEGKLVVYHHGTEGVDIGLRFPEPDDNGVSRCPGCGKKVKTEWL